MEGRMKEKNLRLKQRKEEEAEEEEEEEEDEEEDEEEANCDLFEWGCQFAFDGEKKEERKVKRKLHFLPKYQHQYSLLFWMHIHSGKAS